MKYDQWQKNPVRFLAMTGYTLAQFDELLPYFTDSHDRYLNKFHVDGSRRSGARVYVMYKNSPLYGYNERLVFILSYLKLNPLQEAHADLFSMQQNQCNEFIHCLKIILDDALKQLSMMPATTDEELQTKLTDITDEKEKQVFHDATEREIPRPKDETAQTDAYSGKKKKHTVKNAIITNIACFILFLSPTVKGKMHDKKMADTYYTIKEGFTLWQDTGYQGFKPKGVTLMQPIKKPKGKELTPQQKEYNRQISQVRVRVEHAIGSTKRYRIVKDECRLRKNNFVDSVLHTCAALHNYRISQKQFIYKEIQPINKPT